MTSRIRSRIEYIIPTDTHFTDPLFTVLVLPIHSNLTQKYRILAVNLTQCI